MPRTTPPLHCVREGGIVRGSELEAMKAVINQQGLVHVQVKYHPERATPGRMAEA